MHYLTGTDTSVIWFHDSDLASSERLRIVGIGYPDHMVPGMVDRPHGTDDYLFMHFPTPVEVWSEGAIRPFPAHTFFLWTPGKRHTFGHPQRAWCHYWLHCSGPLVAELLNSAHIPLNQPISFGDSYLPDHCLRPLHDELKEELVPDLTILEACLTLWVRRLDRAVNPDIRNSRVPERILKATQYLNTHLARPIRLEDVAGSVNLSVSRFSAEFRKAQGISPMKFLLEQRLRHAAHLLRDRNLNIAEVSQRTGFNDQFYFSRQFSRKYGDSPLQYRRKLELS